MNSYHVIVYRGAVSIYDRKLKADNTAGVLLILSLQPELQHGFNRVDIRSILNVVGGDQLSVVKGTSS
jgi:hypothetical protein